MLEPAAWIVVAHEVHAQRVVRDDRALAHEVADIEHDIADTALRRRYPPARFRRCLVQAGKREVELPTGGDLAAGIDGADAPALTKLKVLPAYRAAGVIQLARTQRHAARGNQRAALRVGDRRPRQVDVALPAERAGTVVDDATRRYLGKRAAGVGDAAADVGDRRASSASWRRWPRCFPSCC